MSSTDYDEGLARAKAREADIRYSAKARRVLRAVGRDADQATITAGVLADPGIKPDQRSEVTARAIALTQDEQYAGRHIDPATVGGDMPRHTLPEGVDRDMIRDYVHSLRMGRSDVSVDDAQRAAEGARARAGVAR